MILECNLILYFTWGFVLFESGLNFLPSKSSFNSKKKKKLVPCSSSWFGFWITKQVLCLRGMCLFVVSFSVNGIFQWWQHWHSSFCQISQAGSFNNEYENKRCAVLNKALWSGLCNWKQCKPTWVTFKVTSDRPTFPATDPITFGAPWAGLLVLTGSLDGLYVQGNSSVSS